MKTIVLEKNADGKIVMTVDEAKKILDDAYNEGYKDGKNADFVRITYPSYPLPYTTWSATPCDKDTIIVNCGGST